MEYKLLNFTICQIFVVIGMLVLCAKCQEQKMPSAENVTRYDRSFEKVLSRRKRFLVWRPGSNVLLTGSLVKPLAFTRPRGHNLILEWDIFYPLPDSWRKPQKPTPPPPPPPPPPTTSPPEVIESWDHHSPHSGEIWMPSGGWSSDTDVLKTLSEADADADSDTAEKRRWNNIQKSDLRRSGWNENGLNIPPAQYQVTEYKNPLLYNQPWQQLSQTNQFMHNKKYNFNRLNYQSNRQTSPSDANFISMNKQRQMKNLPKGRSLELQNDSQKTQVTKVEETTDDNWKHHYAHRDRRDLYERIEKALPTALTSFDIKSCLLRTICEAQHFLHPPGYSLLQDMLRIVFTIPIKEEMGDDYSIAMQAKHHDCAGVYSMKCPMSILAFLLQAKN